MWHGIFPVCRMEVRWEAAVTPEMDSLEASRVWGFLSPRLHLL